MTSKSEVIHFDEKALSGEVAPMVNGGSTAGVGFTTAEHTQNLEE